MSLRGESLWFCDKNPFGLSSRMKTVTEVCFQLILLYMFLHRQKETQQNIAWFFTFQRGRWSELISERLPERLCHFLHGGKLVYFPWRTRCVNAHQAVCVSVCILQWLMVSAAKYLTEQYLYGVKAHAQMNTHNNSNKERMALGTVWQWRQKLGYEYIWSRRRIVMLKIPHTQSKWWQT